MFNPTSPSDPRPLPRTPVAALTTLVEAIGRDGFARSALEGLNQGMAIGSWAAYRLWPDRPPRLHLSASCGIRDTTHDCFAAYSDGLYRRDRSFERVAAAPGPVMLRMRAEQAPNAEHRERIYRRHGMVERISVARAEADGSLLAVNLYRHAHQGLFAEGETVALMDMAPLLLAGVARHIAWATPPVPQDRRTALLAHCPTLTERETDVCERLLRGWSYDGIAADLGLSVPTVKTYRQRAFARLGIHFKSELFARFLPAPH